MARLLGIRIQNYRAMKDVTLGQIAAGQGEPLPPLLCFIGPNGSGKSSLLDVFGFVADCLKEGVEAACDKPHRGGFSRLRTQGAAGPIAISFRFEAATAQLPIYYEFEIDAVDDVPRVTAERLFQRPSAARVNEPREFMNLVKGKGSVWAGQALKGQSKAMPVEVADLDRLAITAFGQLAEHPRIVALREYIEGWYLSYFVPEAARELPAAGAQKHLDRTGRNLGNVVQYLQRSHSKAFKQVLKQIQGRIPGIKKIETEKSSDGRLLLKFNEQGYEDPFYQYSMSDGTLKMFAYLMLLHDPEPPPFIGIEEPENGLYHRLLEQLAREFRQHAENVESKLQVLVTTHSPYFVDAMQPDQVWLLEKDEQGFTTATRAIDMPTIKAMSEEGIPLGSLWYSNHFEERSFL